MGDVYRELMLIFDKSTEKIGSSLYHYSGFFVDVGRLADSKSQQRIKEYNFCKSFNCPPYPSLKQTPAEVVDDFLIIEQEVLEYQKQLQEEKK